ncbi:MAG: TIGR04211 family SH3 domain-containing protein [Magnetococcales bacterium]|nr:TIGR04211 family SH3 domain-containing protein [Magnetococcales bacterium]MBF0438082.1 TIGR04211 family SH3 domain-containing protein [Magnetococcales bacterium]
MNKLNKFFFQGFFWTLLMFVGSVPVLAEDRYVIDQNINMRQGPQVGSQVLRTLKFGDKLTFLESNSSGWDRVRNGDGNEGWVAHRGLSAKIPPEIERDHMRSELAEMKSKLGSQEKLQNELKRVQEVSRNALRIEQENQELMAKVLRLEKDLKQASDDNRILEKQSDTLFFLSGAGVLLLGFIIGLLSRRRRKPSSYGSLE